jgi:hypothetical protein
MTELFWALVVLTTLFGVRRLSWHLSSGDYHLRPDRPRPPRWARTGGRVTNAPRLNQT